MSRYIKDINGNWQLIAGVSVDQRNFEGTREEWEALSQTEKNKYDTLDLIDDYLGLQFDNVPTENSNNLVNSGVVYSANQTLLNQDNAMLNVLGAKNLLPNNATTQTINGVTFTVNNDGSITVNGTATANIYYQISWVKDIVLTVGESYILSGCPSGSSADSYYIYININGSSLPIYEDERSFTFNSYVTDSEVAIKINSGVTVSNLIFKPMIRSALIKDATYVPYAKTNKELTDAYKLIQPTIKSKSVRIENITIGSSGWTNIASYIPSGMNHFLFAILTTYGNVSSKTALFLNGNGQFISGTANATIDYVLVSYYYFD